MPTIHMLIKGKVQGVFFRATARDVAEKLGILGWVKNTREGHVEIVAQGPAQQLEQFTAWCRQGPENAKVTEVQIRDQEQGFFQSFRVIR